MKYKILSGLFVLGFILSACSETPEEKARNEAKEHCDEARKLAPPTVPQAQLQQLINQCIERETQKKLQQLNNTQGN